MRPTQKIRILRSLGSAWNLPLFEGQTADVEAGAAARLIAAHLAEPAGAVRKPPPEPAATESAIPEPAAPEPTPVVPEPAEPDQTPKKKRGR